MKEYLPFLVSVLLVAGVLWFGHTTDSLNVSSQTVGEIRVTMEKNIEDMGGREAYQTFKQQYENVPFDAQHSASHLFGESLFHSLGLPGISVCDSDFSFGCYHGFFTKAVSEQGLVVVSDLDVACTAVTDAQSISACQHGIGHGILEYVGPLHLSRALEACTNTHQSNPLVGCTSGVFMEYNVPLSVSENGVFSTTARPLENPNEPYHPCTEVAEQFQASCYHELPQWWKQVYGDSMSQMDTFCREIPTAIFRDACYGGIGKIIASSASYDTTRIVRSCTELKDATRREECIVAGAWSLWTSFRDVPAVAVLCSSVSTLARTQCPSTQ